MVSLKKGSIPQDAFDLGNITLHIAQTHIFMGNLNIFFL